MANQMVTQDDVARMKQLKASGSSYADIVRRSGHNVAIGNLGDTADHLREVVAYLEGSHVSV